MADFLADAEALSITDASKKGIAAVARAADEGRDVLLSRHGRPIAAVIGVDRLAELRELERDVRSAALVVARLATDQGKRHDLTEVIAAFGFDRVELEAELDADLAASR